MFPVLRVETPGEVGESLLTARLEAVVLAIKLSAPTVDETAFELGEDTATELLLAVVTSSNFFRFFFFVNPEAMLLSTNMTERYVKML